MNGTDLLAEFRELRSEEAFGELVRRYTHLVYSVARRRLANVALAQEVTQLVFIRLARSVPQLPGDVALVAWLHRTTLHLSIDLWRSEARRRVREEHAVAMHTPPTDEASWNELAPVLDEALDTLNEADRQTLLLRFFEQKPMRDVGAALGISEDAAKMRVSRALDRLRGQLAARHLSCSALGLGALLAENALEAAPGPVVAALASLSLPVPAGGVGGGIAIAIARGLRTKWAAAAVVVGVAGLMTVMLAPSWKGASLHERVGLPSTNAPALQPLGATSGIDEANQLATAIEPDPLQLLQAVARARLRIASGVAQFQSTSSLRMGARREDSALQLTAEFDGPRKRWEQVGREYRYTAPGDASTQQQARIEAEGLDKAAAVRAGLLEGFESRSVTIYDGAARFTYLELDGKVGRTIIDHPNEGSGTCIFDPRCLGLRPHLSVDSTVESCLAYDGAKAVTLVGRDSVNAIPAWQVRVTTKSDLVLNFWLDAGQPVRVLKFSEGNDTAISTYDPRTTSPPVPTEVSAITLHPQYRLEQRFVRTSARFNTPIDPATFTLAGLGMPVGAEVSDDRILRHIGYWTGSGLSKSLPRKDVEFVAIDPGERLAVIESDPASAPALDAAMWLLLNIPDGPIVEKAADAIVQHHLASTNLTLLCQEMDRMRPRCATNLLEAILRENQVVETRATACFVLATLYKAATKDAQPPATAATAAAYFERAITEAGAARSARMKELTRQAKGELHELRHVVVGKMAPETEGEDLDGRRLNLRDFRGQVVVLGFWHTSVAGELAGLRQELERYDGKPLTILGVNGDKDIRRAQASVAKHEIPWPSFRDGGDGAIYSNWNVMSWLTVVVLDQQGVIRHRGHIDREFHGTLASLLGD